MKNSISKKEKEFDQVKLKKYTASRESDLLYKYGVYIEYDDDKKENLSTIRNHKIKYYEDGACIKESPSPSMAQAIIV